MDQISRLIMAGIALALFLQPCSCFFTKKRPLSIGFLNLFLATLVIFVSVSVLTANLVVASDLGAIMVGGNSMAWLLRVALVVAAMVPGLCWYRIRTLNGWPFPLW